MLRYWLISGLACALLLAQKPKAKDPYDPKKLPANEVACGRVELVHCDCMKARVAKIDVLLEKCAREGNRQKRIACYAEVPACPVVTDADTAWQQEPPMPPQCKRSCHKARCECCKT